MQENPLGANYSTRRSQFCGDEQGTNGSLADPTSKSTHKWNCDEHRSKRRRNEILLHVIRNEKSCYERMKLNVRMFCAWLLNRG